MAKTFDDTVKKMCRKKIASPDEPLLKEKFTVEQAISEALIRKAFGGAADAVKLIREILSSPAAATSSKFQIDINVVD